MPALSRRQLLFSGLCAAFSGSALGCGTVLHPERRGQAAGPLDWKIVALDAVGLLFFFVPGVIAFAVDFSNGTIYMPSESYSSSGSRPDSTELQIVDLPASDMTYSQIEQVVSNRAGREVRLVPGEFVTRELQNIDEFWVASQSFRDA